MTRMTDYAIVLLTHCARHSERPLHTTRDLAGEAHLPLPTVGKVLKLLAREGLLHSHRGAHGGYSLARRPSAISVAEIVRTMEGPVAITECSHETPGQCDLEGLCPVRGNWRRINGVVWEALEGLTLADMAQPFPEPFFPLRIQGHGVESPKAL